MTSTDTRDGITLTCTPERQGETIIMTYGVANGGTSVAYVSDAGMRVEPSTRTASADPDQVSIWLTHDRYAKVLKGVPPPPEDADVLFTIMPLMVALEPGASIARTLILALPLAEQSPYFGVGNLRDYRLAEIEGMVLAIDVFARVPSGFVPRPVSYAPGHVNIGVRGTIPLLTRLSCRFPTRGMQMMVLTHAYPRPD